MALWHLNRFRVISKAGLTILVSIVVLFALVGAASAQTRTVGVNVGDTFKYSVSVTWSSNDPTATPSQELIDENGSQMQFVVTAISGTNVTLELTELFKNGTQIPVGGWVDVDTGDSNSIFTFDLISANLVAGDSIYSSSGSYGAITINETVAKTYPNGVARDTNHFIMTVPSLGEGLSVEMNYYWDKSTGILVELSTNEVNQTAQYTTTTSMDEQIISSTIWTVPEFPNWILPILTLIVVSSAFTLIARRKQTKRPLP